MIGLHLHLPDQSQRTVLVLHTSLVFLWLGLSVGVAVLVSPPGPAWGEYSLVAQGSFDQLVVYEVDSWTRSFSPPLGRQVVVQNEYLEYRLPPVESNFFPTVFIFILCNLLRHSTFCLL